MKKSASILMIWFAVSCLFLFIFSAITYAIQPNISTQTANQTFAAQSTENVPSFLTGSNEGLPLDIALSYLQDHKEESGLTDSDLDELAVTDQYVSKHTGVTHIYLQQRFDGIYVQNTTTNINIAADGSVINIGNRLIPNLSEAIRERTPRLSASEAVALSAESLDLDVTSSLPIIKQSVDNQQETTFDDGGIALQPIVARLVYVPHTNGTVWLAWQVEIYESSALHYWVNHVDALNGRVSGTYDLVKHDSWSADTTPTGTAQVQQTLKAYPAFQQAIPQFLLAPDSYFVFPMPLESPNHANPPLPPTSEDNRVLVHDPATSASPFGWHDTNGAAGAEYTITRGNNAHAYEDSGNNNASIGNEPDGGPTLFFSQTMDLSLPPSTYHSATVTNLFYWNNIIHDVMYAYGFDEVSGNFQENNYGNGGAGSDYVYAEAQDGSGSCNANFSTPADGGNGRMQMYVCGDRDGDLDSGVIIHEYGHGISNRLTGGPATASCLNNSEQMGEGWSDWFSLMLTMESGDAGTDSRGIGTYLLGEAADGPGIRPAPYSTDMGVNNYTYGDIGAVAVPHGVGFVWATIIWDVNWALVDQYGFDTDFYTGTGGNNLAMQLVIDGLKLQTCSPGFVDGRDAILQADQILTGGQNQCLMWEAFAQRGLGYSADQGSSGSTSDGTEAFDLPPLCLQTLKIEKSANPDPVTAGNIMTYSLVATNDTVGTLTAVTISDTVPANTSYVPGSASHGGTETGGVVTFPGVTLLTGEAITRTFLVQVDNGIGTTELFFEDFESGFGNWTMAGLWNAENESDTCGGMQAPFPSSSNAAYYGDDTACDYDTGSANSGSLTLVTPIDLSTATSPVLSFSSFENSEDNSSYDQRFVEISINGGSSWSQLAQLTTENAWYNVELDLSAYNGETVLIRFRFDTVDGIGNAHFGWMIDDIQIENEVTIPNTACVEAAEGDSACDSIETLVLGTPVSTVLLTIASDGTGSGSVNPAEGAHSYPLNSTVWLTATVDAGSSFAGWSGDLTGTTNPISITLDSNKTVTATFTSDPVPMVDLTIATDGTGSGSVNPAEGDHSYPLNSTVWLTATADAGSSFAGWSGDLTGTTNPISITLDSDKTVTATFTSDAEPMVELTIVTDGLGSGSVNPAVGDHLYPLNSTVWLTATANAGSSFMGWSGDLMGATNPISITLDSDKMVTATFGVETSYSIYLPIVLKD